MNKTYISNENISTFAKVQSAGGFADRGEIVLVWDSLNRSQKNLAKNINIDGLKVRTSDPRSVPDKWNDSIVEEDAEPEAVDFIKQIIANPARYDVYEMLKDYDPSEPLMLWWIEKTFTDEEYFKVLSEACRYGLFRGDTKYLWAAIAFGVDAGVGRFHWPESDKEPKEIKSVKKKLVEEREIDKHELDKIWEFVRDDIQDYVEISEAEAKQLGIEWEEPEPEEDDDESEKTSLLDFE